MNIVKEQKKEYVAPEMNVLEYECFTSLLSGSGSDETDTAAEDDYVGGFN